MPDPSDPLHRQDAAVNSDPRLRQLALAFPLNSHCRFEDFVSGQNAEVVAVLRALLDRDGGFRGCLLAGTRGAGKTHLLQATCRYLGDGAGGVIYLPLADRSVAPDILEGLERFALVALDDVDAWLGDPDRERALLGLYQGLVAAEGTLLVAVSQAAHALRGHYPDLLSRLRALTAYTLRPLDDAGNADVLRRLAGERGLELGQPVLDYWLSRGSRDLVSLIEQLERLDAMAMATQRRISVPLLKSVLGL